MRSPILLSLTVSVSISVAGSALAQSQRTDVQQQSQGVFYSESCARPVKTSGGSQAEPVSSEKLIDTSKAIIDASRAIQDLSETLNSAPEEAPVDEEATAAAEAALQAAQSGQESVTPPDETPLTAPNQVAKGSEATPQQIEQVNPWRVPNTSKVYDETGSGVATKTQELIQSLGIDQQAVSASAQTGESKPAEKPVSTPVAAVSKPPVPVFVTTKQNDSPQSTEVQAKPIVAASEETPVAAVATTPAPVAAEPTTPVATTPAPVAAEPPTPVATAPAPVAAEPPTPVATAPATVAAELTPVATAPATVAAEPTTPVATTPATVAAELTPVATAPATTTKSALGTDLRTPVLESVERASSGTPIPFNETAISVTQATTETAKQSPIASPVAPTIPVPRVEMAKSKAAPAPAKVAQPTRKVEEKPVVARREFPSVRNAFSRLGKSPQLVSRLKAWSTEPVEDWTDPSSVSNEGISPRKGIENMGKKIATFGHVKSWIGKSEVQSGSQVAAKPQKQDATAKPAVETTLERIKTESPVPSSSPDAPKTWY